MRTAENWLAALAYAGLLRFVVQTLVPKGGLERLSRFACGVVFLLVLIRPLTGELPQLPREWDTFEEQMAETRAEWTESEASRLGDDIAQRTAAYIRNRADELGDDLTARVTVRVGAEGLPLPWAVVLRGRRLPALESWITRELGIPAERISWQEDNDET